MGLLFKLSQVPLDSISSFSCIIWTTQLVSSADLLRCNLSHCLCQRWRCAMENSLATITASSFRTLGFMLSSLTDILRFLNYAAYYRITLALYVRESSWLLIFFLLIQCFFFFFQNRCAVQFKMYTKPVRQMVAGSITHEESHSENNEVGTLTNETLLFARHIVKL